MKGAFRARWAILLLLCAPWWHMAQAEMLPWEVINLDARTAFFDIQSSLVSGKYEAAVQRGELAFAQCKRHPSDALLLIVTVARVKVRQTKPDEALQLLKWAQLQYSAQLKAPLALAYLLEAYGDLALEVPDAATRETTVRKLQHVHDILPIGNPRKATIALKVAMLMRLLGDPNSSQWLDAAEPSGEAPCDMTLRYLQERVYVAIKAKDRGAAKTFMDETRRALDDCPDAMPEDLIMQHFNEHEFHDLVADLDGEDMTTLSTKQAAIDAAIAVGRRMPEVHPALLDLCLNRMASIVGEMGNTAAAAEYAQEALDGSMRRPYAPKSLSSAYSELARWQHFLGRTQEALMNYRQALLSFPKTAPLDWKRQNTKQYNYIQALVSASAFAEAEELTKTAEQDLLLHAPDEYYLRARLQEAIGIGLEMQQKFAMSIPRLRKAIELYEQVPIKPNLEIACCKTSLAICYLQIGDTAEAAPHAQSALHILKSDMGGTLLERARVSEVLSDYFLMRRDMEMALATNQQFLSATISQDAASTDAGPVSCNGCPDLQQTISPWNTLMAVVQRVQILRARQAGGGDTCELVQALRCTQSALATMYQLRRERAIEVEKLEFNKRWHVLFALGMETAHDLHQLTREPRYVQEAFEIAEQSKAMLLMEGLLENQALERDPQNAVLVDRRQVLTAYISQIRKQLAQSGTNPQLSIALTTARRNLEEVNRRIQAQNPNYSDLVNAFTVVTPTQLQPQLRDQQRALVEYFHTDSALHILVVTADTLAAVRVPLDATFGGQLRRFTQCLHAYTGRAPQEELAELVSTSAAVKQVVWDPIDPLVRAYHRVTVIPDGPLSLLSFEALLLPSTESDPTQSKKLRDLRYLLDVYTISYDYSGTYLASRRQVPASPEWRTLAIAPSFGDHASVEALPNTVHGVKRLARDYSNISTLLEAEASKPNFVTLAPNYDVLDIATHGSFDHGDFLRSALYFAPIGDSDSLLTVEELYRLKLRTQLAILEACESGLGDVREGEGVMSLARAFTYAGCRSVLMSLWDVAESQSTRQIMRAFYQNLCEGMPRDEAITAAKRSFLAQARSGSSGLAHLLHPYYWAEMVLIGDLTPMPKQVARAQLPWTFIAMTALGGLFLAVVTLRIRASQRRKARA